MQGINARHLKAIDAYRDIGNQSAVVDASPYQLISMLMNGALDRIAAARGAMARGDAALQGSMIGKAIGIVDGMRASLDEQRGGPAGGELATRLRDLYDYMERRLLEAGAGGDQQALDEVAGLLREVKSGWDAIPAEYRG